MKRTLVKWDSEQCSKAIGVQAKIWSAADVSHFNTFHPVFGVPNPSIPIRCDWPSILQESPQHWVVHNGYWLSPIRPNIAVSSIATGWVFRTGSQKGPWQPPITINQPGNIISSIILIETVHSNNWQHVLFWSLLKWVCRKVMAFPQPSGFGENSVSDKRPFWWGRFGWSMKPGYPIVRLTHIHLHDNEFLSYHTTTLHFRRLWFSISVSFRKIHLLCIYTHIRQLWN